MRQSSAILAAMIVFSAGACSSGEKAASDTAAADTAAAAPAMGGEPSVSIVSPADGDTVSLPFTVRLEAQGVEVIPASGVSEPGKGHHHLVINEDAPADTVALPATAQVIHMGTGVSERVLDSLPAGSHRIIAIFAGGDHVPMTSVKRDTITVVVKN